MKTKNEINEYLNSAIEFISIEEVEHKPIKPIDRLIEIIVLNKEYSLELDFYLKNKLLPTKIINTVIANEIIKINESLYSIDNLKWFYRPLEIENIININAIEFIHDSIDSLYIETKNDYYNFKITDNDIEQIEKNKFQSNNKIAKTINLPKIEELTNTISLLFYYRYLLIEFYNLEKGKKISAPTKPHQLQTNLTDTQRGKLFDLLLSNKYIALTTNKDCFIWAFGGNQSQPNNWQPIEWIDTSVTRKEPNIQTLYELLYLLGVDKDTSANNKNNLYRKMEFCFSDLKNIAAKNPCSIQQKTFRQIELKTIIEEVEKIRAQK